MPLTRGRLVLLRGREAVAAARFRGMSTTHRNDSDPITRRPGWGVVRFHRNAVASLTVILLSSFVDALRSVLGWPALAFGL